MNEMRSSATSDSACSASKRRTSTERIRAAPGSNTPLSMPEMWAIGAGISTASPAPRPCTCAMSDAFQLRPRCVCSTALGTPVEPEVNNTRATSEGRTPLDPAATGGPPSAASSAEGSDSASVGQLQHQARLDLGQRLLHVGGAERVQHRRRDRAEAPAGPAEHGGGQAVGHLPGHGLTAAYAPGAQPAGHRGHQRLHPAPPTAGSPRRRPHHRRHRAHRPRSTAMRRASAPATARPGAGSGGHGSAPTWLGGGPSRLGPYPATPLT